MGNSVSANDPVQYVNFMTDGVCAETPAANGTYWRSWQADLKADCCPGGMFVGDIPRNPGLAIVWILILCWIFMGVALGAEVFMTAIEVVTAKELSKRTPDGKVYHVAVWNATVANLTLMALGSSAPEILLSIIEVLNLNFNAGDLGPSTIVGSAAFNLMVITAVCIVCLPEGEKRTLNQFGVFLTTASYSIIAYIWLYIIVLAWTPEVVTVAEGVITCVLMIILIGQAYAADKYQEKQTQAKKYKGVGGVKGVSKGEAAAAIKAANLPKDATPMQIHQALEEELMPPKSKLHYRKQAIGLAKNPPGNATKVMPEIEDMDGGRAKRVDANMADSPPPTNDPDAAGMIMWAKPTYEVMESGGSVTVEVVRVGGTKGEVSCSYTTKNQKAVAGKDFKACDGTLTWADGATDKKEIAIEIYDDDEFEKDEEFTVVLSDIKGGAKFNDHTDGGDETDVCTVTILNDDDRATKLVEAIRMLRLDADSLDLATDDWMGAIKEAVIPPGEGGANAMVMHLLMVPWKLMFAILPPPGLCGGWPCFLSALVGIGFQVILISDFATQVGCQMYLKTTVTAITFVALGTSLPDTFASVQAARGDKYADNSVGNVTGSNSVNVFFGLGLPWLIAAIYWSGAGATPEWIERFHPVSGTHPLPVEIFNEYKSTGAFIVRSGDLGISVVTFTICAIITIGLILVRRSMGRQELGGNRPFAIASAVLLVFLWFVYITVSCLATYGFLG